MPKLLVIISSPQNDRSASRQVTKAFVEKWSASFPDGEIVTRDLASAPPPLVDEAWINAAFSDPSTHTPESTAAIRFSNEVVAELQSADHIVIGTPMHNLMVPATLKAYIDQIVRVGLTVSPTNEGLLAGKKAAVIVASGGDLSPGSPAEKFNHLAPYLRTVLGFIGITDVEILMAGPTRPIAFGQQSIDEFVQSYQNNMSAIIDTWR